MAGWEFWATALCLATGSALVLVRALQRAGPEAAGGPTAAADLAVYKDQLAEVARDLQRGTIGPEEAERIRIEVSRRLLEADRVDRKTAPTGKALPGAAVSLCILSLTLPAAVAAYWLIGAPGTPDMALEPRLAALDQAIASRPGQEAELQAQGRPRDAALDARLSTELAAITDPATLRELLRQRLEKGETQAAVRTGERVLALLGDRADAADHASLALALVIEVNGYVSPEAETQLRETLARDLSNELARYLVGEMFLQGGRFDQTFRFWRPIAEEGDPARPWVASIRDRIDEVAELAGIRYSLPEAAKGPSDDDMAAAADMSPEEQQAMIEGMVAQLSDRLASEGGTVEEWGRLIRSLAVLKRTDEAQDIYDEAKTRFAGQAAELSFLKLAAVESGLQP